MNYRLYDSGKRLFRRLIAGEQAPKYGLYVTYANKAMDDVPEATKEFFEALASGTYTGYARVPVTAVNAVADGVAFIGMLASEDLIGGKLTKNTVITSATLVSLGETTETDEFLYTALFKQPVKVTEGAYITVNLKINLG